MKSIKVQTLRETIKSRQCEIPHGPGIYCWWFQEEGAQTLLNALPEVDLSKIACRTVDGKRWLALYFGVSKDLRGRLRWHLTQHHTLSSVKSGFISTLRFSLSALLGIPATEAEEKVNHFMDEYCMINYKSVESIEEAGVIEKKELSTKYYPLNIANNRSVDRHIMLALTKLRSENRH